VVTSLVAFDHTVATCGRWVAVAVAIAVAVAVAVTVVAARFRRGARGGLILGGPEARGVHGRHGVVAARTVAFIRGLGRYAALKLIGRFAAGLRRDTERAFFAEQLGAGLVAGGLMAVLDDR